MGCNNSKVGPVPAESGQQQAWAAGAKRGPKGWRRVLGMVRNPCVGNTKVVPIGVNPAIGIDAVERTDFNTPVCDIPESPIGQPEPACATADQSKPALEQPGGNVEVMGVVDLEADPTKSNATEYFATSSASPLPARLPTVKRAWRERPPSRGGIKLELALYGKNTTRPFPSCLGRAVLDNKTFTDTKLKEDIRRAQKLHLEAQLDSVRSHNGRIPTPNPSAARSRLDAFMEHERSGPRTKFGRMLHKVGVSPVEEEQEKELDPVVLRRTSAQDVRCETACRGQFDFYY